MPRHETVRTPPLRSSQYRVCMFVWNTFTTDARVTREAETLAEDGWDVWVIAIVDPRQPKPFERRGVVNIIRVDPRFRPPRPQMDVEQYSLKDRPAARKHIPQFLSRLITIGRHWVSFNLTSLKLTWVGWKLAADVYHCHDLNTVIPGAICSRLLGRPVIYDSHEIHMDKHSRYNRFEMLVWSFIERHFIRRVTRCITTTKLRSKWLARKYRIPDPTVIHNFAAYRPLKRTSVLHERLGVQPDKPILLYQGGIQAHRGLEQIIEAAHWIKPEATVVFLGEGPLWDKIERMISLSGMRERIRMLPGVSYEQLWSHTASAAIGLQCLQDTCFNHRSTGSNKLFEYFMAGIPVVASDFPFIREVLTDTGAGILVTPNDPKQIAEAINKLLRPDTYNVYSRNARQAARKYNWDREKGVLCRLYLDIEKDHLGRNRSDLYAHA